MSDTNPLPANEFRRLMSELVTAANEYANDSLDSRKLDTAIAACMTVLRTSPVTLEEFLIVQEEDAQWCRTTVEWIEAVEMTHKHALVLIDARDNARRLAGEGGGQ